jgi:hypothetical protein
MSFPPTQFTSLPCHLAVCLHGANLCVGVQAAKELQGKRANSVQDMDAISAPGAAEDE